MPAPALRRPALRLCRHTPLRRVGGHGFRAPTSRRSGRRRRHGVLRSRLLRWRGRDADARSPGTGRRAALALLQHRSMQPVAGLAAHRTASAPDRPRHPHQRRSTAGLPRVAESPMRDAGRDAAAGGVCDVPQRQVAPRVGGVGALRRVADAARLRSLLRHAVGLRELLSPDHADAHGGQRRARGGRARVLLHRRHHAGSGGLRQSAGQPRARAPVLPLHGVHGAALAAARAAGRHRAVSRRLRCRMGRAARGAAETAGGRGDHAGRDDAERSRSKPARVAGCAAPGVAARADAGVRRADRPDGSGHRAHRDGAGRDRGAREHALPVPVGQRRERRAPADRRCRELPPPARHRAAFDLGRRAAAHRQLAGHRARAPRTPTRAMGGRGPTSPTRRSASTSAGSTKVGSRRR